ncbi:phosphomannomutase/phosphoglucomutase [Candidatus Woesearchaeota archaeon]|nr:phosphomannomutase/phosphoglucomutase [Candidatus Woesearchaeota archaeon]
MILKPSIFKAYDIRGEWNKEWDSEGVYHLAHAFATHFKPKNVAIGYDMRFSSPEIFKQLTNAFRERGINVIDLGLCATELVYYVSSYVPNVDLALMITASHNEGKDNGIKVVLPNAVCVGLNSGLDRVRDIAASQPIISNEIKHGSLTKYDAWEGYKRHVFSLASKTSFSKRYNLVIDAGNGVGSVLVDNTISSLNLNIIHQCWTLDGSFPNHLADPSQEKNTLDCQQRVKEQKADLGVCLDGDSDRVFFIDEKGRYIPGYYLAALLTNHMLKQSPNPHQEHIVHDPRYYKATRKVIAAHRATAHKVKVGHTLIKDAMRRVESLFSAECSGHIFYKQNNYAESTMLTILHVLKIIEEYGTLSKAVDPFFTQYFISGEINFIVQNQPEILKALETKYHDATIDYTDGVDIAYQDWRCSVRGSNTQPLLRLNIEATQKDLVDAKLAELKNLIGGTLADH